MNSYEELIDKSIEAATAALGWASSRPEAAQTLVGVSEAYRLLAQAVLCDQDRQRAEDLRTIAREEMGAAVQEWNLDMVRRMRSRA